MSTSITRTAASAFQRRSSTTPRRAVRLLAGDPDRVTDEDRRFVQALRERSPSIATVADLIARFCKMVKGKLPDPFDGWRRVKVWT